MHRREFLTASAALAATATLLANDARGADDQPRMFYELRTYHFASAAKQQAYEQFLQSSAIPAFNRAGVDPVGVFKLLSKDNPPLKLTEDSTDLIVLLPHKGIESVINLEGKLGADADFQKSGAAILNSSKDDPAYVRYDTSLLYAFPLAPKIDVPTKSPTRVLQLRTYESRNNERAAKKIEMFNQGGELTIFKRTGMTGVFFGQALAGAKLPNLTYMLGFDDPAALDKAWKAFRDDPDWKRLSKDDQYKDTVSTITNLILRPAAGSQV
jgi:hypothetical protein